VDPQADVRSARQTYVDLGRGEYHAGRSLDALLAAYRVGARLAWRRFVETGREAGLAPEVLYDLGEAIFAYIDEISAESADGYAQEQSAAAEVDVGLARAADVGLRVHDEAQEAREGDLDAAPDGRPEFALHGARIVGHLGGDRLDRLVGKARQHGPQDLCGLGRDGGERPGGLGHL